jgi:prepilin signal peptidase PulO-like enzyme (type II secretory pathway)
VLVTLSMFDATHRIMPNRIVLPAAGVALFAHTAIEPSLAWLAWSLAGAGVLFLVVLTGPKRLGMGEVKLALLLGAALGASVTVALLVGLFAALVPAAIFVARYGASAPKTGGPLAPFLALGAVVALFVGDAVLDVYRGLF